jgi:hypothetical protein
VQLPISSGACHAAFHRRWGHLQDADVRALAWLLDSPDLLDPHAPQWEAKIATLADAAGPDAATWLEELDRDPAPLRAYLALRPFTRLGRYAEKLLAYYFLHQGVLVANGLQVRASKNDTIGEFDFLLRRGAELVHWEFAIKLYLLETSGSGAEADYFVGPNLADTLGLKMRKILGRQLELAQHPAAQSYLPQPVASSCALVKGWLFYHEDDVTSAQPSGVLPAHCRGFWCTLSEFGALAAERFMILPRLSWLAPMRAPVHDTVEHAALSKSLAAYFESNTMPVLIGMMQVSGEHAIEQARGFIVPDNWRSRAVERIRDMRRTAAIIRD